MTSRCWRFGKISTRFSVMFSKTPANGLGRHVVSTPVSTPAALSSSSTTTVLASPRRCATACRPADSEPTGAAPGSGLGLSIAHDLVDAYGGRTLLDESPLGGLRVVIDLQAPRT